MWTQSSHLDTFTHTVMRRHPLIKSCGIYSNPDQRVENKAGALARFTTVTSRDCYLFSQKGEERGKKTGLSQCQALLTVWSKQLRRKATQRLGRSRHPWLWWDKMSSPWDIICCLALPTAHCSYLSPTVTLILPGMSSEIVKALIKD